MIPETWTKESSLFRISIDPLSILKNLVVVWTLNGNVICPLVNANAEADPEHLVGAAALPLPKSPPAESPFHKSR